MNKIKEFFTSYWDLCKESAKWMKEHWLGYIIVCAIIILPYWIWYFSWIYKTKKLEKEISTEKCY